MFPLLKHLYLCLDSKDEAERLVKLDQQEIENDEWGALGDAVTEGGEGVVKATQTARDEAEGNGNEAESRLRLNAEGKREPVAERRMAWGMSVSRAIMTT